MNEGMKRPRWLRLQFSLRTLFFAITLFGIWLGWQVWIVNARKESLRRIESIGGVVLADSNLFGGSPYGCTFEPYTPPPPPDVTWVRKLFGDRAIQTIGLPETISQAEQVKIRTQFPEATFWPVVDGEIRFVVGPQPILTSELQFNYDSPPREEYPGRIEALELHCVGELLSR
jgi:hypothetical protein